MNEPRERHGGDDEDEVRFERYDAADDSGRYDALGRDAR